jgi:CheY-like chemotaxis protein
LTPEPVCEAAARAVVARCMSEPDLHEYRVGVLAKETLWPTVYRSNVAADRRLRIPRQVGSRRNTVGVMMKVDEVSDVAPSTVLIVDDEPDIRFLLRVTLEQAGYGVVEASHGDAALECVRISPPALVITDRMMPRMGGAELILRLRADRATAAIPIVMVTGTNGSEPGADAVLKKPFEPAELIGLVSRLIEGEH